MGDKRQKFCSQTVFQWCSVLMLLVFMPVLFCVLAIGNNMDYWDPIKQTELLYSTQVIGLLAVFGAVLFVCILYLCRNWQINWKWNLIVNLLLFGVFLGVYFFNTMVCREIAFKLPWDIMMVRGFGYYAGIGEPLGYNSYLSVYPNNIPISYFLGRIYRTVLERGDFPYVIEYAWMQVGCVLISIAGFFSCLTVKKLTKKFLPTIVCFLAVFVLVECSAWKMAPYTDTYAISFSVMSIYFYFLSIDDKRAGGVYIKKVLWKEEDICSSYYHFCVQL